MITERNVDRKILPPFHGLFHVLNNHQHRGMIPGACTIRGTEYKSDSRLLETSSSSFFSSSLLLFFENRQYIFFLVAHAGYNTQSAIIFVLLLPFLFSPSSLYIFLMEFHFLRVLKTCAKKRRCEKKLENTCLPYDKTTHPHTRRQYTERGERHGWFIFSRWERSFEQNFFSFFFFVLETLFRKMVDGNLREKTRGKIWTMRPKIRTRFQLVTSRAPYPLRHRRFATSFVSLHIYIYTFGPIIQSVSEPKQVNKKGWWFRGKSMRFRLRGDVSCTPLGNLTSWGTGPRREARR